MRGFELEFKFKLLDITVALKDLCPSPLVFLEKNREVIKQYVSGQGILQLDQQCQETMAKLAPVLDIFKSIKGDQYNVAATVDFLARNLLSRAPPVLFSSNSFTSEAWTLVKEGTSDLITVLSRAAQEDEVVDRLGTAIKFILSGNSSGIDANGFDANLIAGKLLTIIMKGSTLDWERVRSLMQIKDDDSEMTFHDQEMTEFDPHALDGMMLYLEDSESSHEVLKAKVQLVHVELPSAKRRKVEQAIISEDISTESQDQTSSDEMQQKLKSKATAPT